ncbi:MAG: RNA polymerase sigma factor [Anaerolineae bacterium]
MQEPSAVLLGRCRNGDAAAFAELVAEQQAYVYNLALRLLGDSAEAEDLAQEALVRAWQMLPSFRGEARFTTWLYRIVVNLGLNRRARLRRTLATVSLDDVACPQVPGVEPDPLLAQTDLERKEWIWRQVDALPERYRVVIALYYQQERTYDEMAQILCLPLNTVKTHLARARHLLARRLAEAQGGLDAL